MLVKPSSAFVEKPSLVASSSGRAKNARYARLFPSTRKSSESRAGPSSSCSSSPVSVFGDISASLRRVAEHEIVPFTDAHLDDAAALLAGRHERQREAEPLLPADVDFRAELEREWQRENASGVFAGDAFLLGAPHELAGIWWLRVELAGQAIEGERERTRDLYAAAAARWVDEGHTKQAVFVPSHDSELVDAWFRLGFGGSATLSMRETGPEEPFDGNVDIRRGTPDDFGETARLERELSAAMQPAPSFSELPLQRLEAIQTG